MTLNLSKKLAERRHALKRLNERYDQKETTKFLKTLASYISAGKSVYEDGTEVRFLLKQSNRVSHFSVKFQGTEYIVVFDRKRKTPITFLPPRKES